MMASEFTVADVLEWARTKPADAPYDYCDPTNCGLCQFLRETGRALEPRVALNRWRDGLGAGYRRFDGALQNALNDPDQTFGGLVRRLEALVQEAPAKPSVWLSPQTYIDCDCGQVPA